MAQNELQRMAKTEFYAQVRTLNALIKRVLGEMKDASEWLASMDAQTASDMAITDSALLQELVSFRLALSETIDFIEGTGVTQTKVLKDSVDKLRYMSVR